MNTIRNLISLLIVISMTMTGCVAIDSGINSDFDFDDMNNESVYGSGQTVTLEKEYTGFTALELSHSFSSSITKGDQYSVIVRIDDNLIDYLETSQSGGKISLGMQSGYNYKNITLEAEITMPDIEDLNLSGACYANLQNFDFSHTLGLELSGASRADGSIKTGDVYFDLSGASSIEFNGSGKNYYIECSGASHINLRNFSGENAVINLSGASVSTLNVSGSIRADLSGASVLYYVGDPSFTRLHISGESNVIKL